MIRYLVSMCANRLMMCNVWATMPLITTIGIVAGLDSFNHYTTTIYNWRALAMFTFMWLAMTCGVWIAQALLLPKFDAYHAKLTSDSSATKGDKASASLLGSPTAKSTTAKSPTAKSPVAAFTSHDQWQRNRALILVNLLYNGSLLAEFVFIVWHAFFIYDYAGKTEGYTSLLNDGFNTAGSATFVMNKKLALLDLFQRAAVTSMGLALVVFGVRRTFPETKIKDTLG